MAANRGQAFRQIWLKFRFKMRFRLTSYDLWGASPVIQQAAPDNYSQTAIL